MIITYDMAIFFNRLIIYMTNLLNSCISFMESSPIYKDKLVPYFENASKEYTQIKNKIMIAYIILVLLILVVILLLCKISMQFTHRPS